MKKNYLDEIRANSCYPTFRAVVLVATIATYLAAGLIIIAGIIAKEFIIGAAVAIIVAIVAKVAQEVSLMIADIADATIDSASKTLKDKVQTLPIAQTPPPNPVTSQYKKNTQEKTEQANPEISNFVELHSTNYQEVPETIRTEVEKLARQLSKYGYEIIKYDPKKQVWIVTTTSGEFSQSLDDLKALVKNFEK